MTSAQNRKIHALLSSLGLIDDKPHIIYELTNGRTTHASELTTAEANRLIEFLQMRAPSSYNTSCNRQRRRIISICHQLGWYKRDEKGDILLKKGKPVIDMDRINRFCMTRGFKKKPLMKYNKKELQKLVYQFEQILKNELNKRK